VAAAGRPARDGAGCREGDEQDDEHPQQHQQKISEPERPTVLSFGASEISRSWELDTRADAPPEEVQEEWDRGGARKGEPEWREKAHGSSWRAANARLSGTPKGESVVMTS
jgi:hypothetical protein